MTSTIPPPPPEIRFGAVFSASWRLFVRNWVIAVPPVLAGIVISIALCGYVAVLIGALGVAGWSALLTSQHVDQAAVTTLVLVGMLGGCVLFVVAVLAALWSECAMYGMADAAWARGTTTLSDGFAAFRSRAGAVVVAFIGICGLALVALVLALPTLFLSLLALPFVTFYAIPAAVGGGRDGFDAIGESFRLIRRFFGPSIITWLLLIAIQYGVSMLMSFAVFPLEFSAAPAQPDGLPRMPPVPLFAFSGVAYIVSLLALIAYSGFRALVQVGLFREVEAQPPVPVLAAVPVAMPRPLPPT